MAVCTPRSQQSLLCFSFLREPEMANRRCTCLEPFLPCSAWTLSGPSHCSCILTLDPLVLSSSPLSGPYESCHFLSWQAAGRGEGCRPTFALRALENCSQRRLVTGCVQEILIKWERAWGGREALWGPPPHPRHTQNKIPPPFSPPYVGWDAKGFSAMALPNRYLYASVVFHMENWDAVMSSLLIKWWNIKLCLWKLSGLSNTKGTENRLTEGKCVCKSFLVYYY